MDTDSPTEPASEPTEETLPPSSAPDSFRVSCIGFAIAEDAENVGQTVGQLVRVFGCRFDLSHLDAVTVAYDYRQALLDLDRGYETSHQLTPSDEYAVGVAMTPSVIRDGVVKSHILLNANVIAPIAVEDDPRNRLAVHVLAHECAHVEITRKFDGAFPDWTLRHRFADIWERARSEVSSAVWEEYAATTLSAPFGEDPTNGYEDTFISVLGAARDRANEAIIAYRTRENEGIDQVVVDVYGTYGNLLKFAAYHLGNLAGSRRTYASMPRTVAALDGHWFSPYFERLRFACSTLMENYGNWTELSVFDLIADIADEIVAEGGLHFSRLADGRVHVNIPYTRDTMPASWEPED